MVYKDGFPFLEKKRLAGETLKALWQIEIFTQKYEGSGFKVKLSEL